MSAKYAKHEGIPIPNDAPKRRDILQTCNKATLVSRAGKNDEKTPKTVHAQRNLSLPTLFDKNVPTMLDTMIET
jgi:hypothetical protein